MVKAARKSVKKTARRMYRQEVSNGVISATEGYTLRELYSRFGFGGKWLRNARKNGLKIVPIGRQKGVLGETLLAYLKTQES